MVHLDGNECSGVSLSTGIPAESKVWAGSSALRISWHCRDGERAFPYLFQAESVPVGTEKASLASHASSPVSADSRWKDRACRQVFLHRFRVWNHTLRRLRSASHRAIRDQVASRTDRSEELCTYPLDTKSLHPCRAKSWSVYSDRTWWKWQVTILSNWKLQKSSHIIHYT